MRAWSLHPKYLDKEGLTGCWGETLQGKLALQGKIKMHRNHPQLYRFKRLKEKGVSGIDSYLYFVYLEAKSRGYNFDIFKILDVDPDLRLPISKKQLLRERLLLNEKLANRGQFDKITDEMDPNPIFYIVDDFEDLIEKGDRL